MAKKLNNQYRKSFTLQGNTLLELIQNDPQVEVAIDRVLDHLITKPKGKPKGTKLPLSGGNA